MGPLNPAVEVAVAPSPTARVFAWLKQWLWDRDMRFERTGRQLYWLAGLSALAFLPALWSTYQGLKSAKGDYRGFFLDVVVKLSEVPNARVVTTLVVLTVVYNLYMLLGGIADMVFYRRTRGKAFPWELFINVAAVNLIFDHVFGGLNVTLTGLMAGYGALIDTIPTLVHFSGPVAVFVAWAVSDFGYYWAHRLAHRIRFFWNLAHVSHHRTKELNELSFYHEPAFALVDTSFGGGLRLLLYPLMAKLFTSDLSTSGWALVVLGGIQIYLSTQHSMLMYTLESRFAPLRWLRWVLCTSAVHVTHHARSQEYNLSHGCNFASQLALWDRLFGTYAEPPREIPECGLYDDKADYCLTPVKFVLYPFVRMGLELKANSLRHWPAILFGPTTYNPPVKVDMPV